ncbi:conserved hypothetical protein [Talaromyces stipitatus ATCC 10500]|uniref:Uncharacterized protein n=1 Tax=Talaromyces stipitatus (strain ATCC 10500 / CBS 375.48 / QM 6759 / NRRL 1006) TaxID=441959 RepID=B8MSC6_TALSN|nr:uncharacterized protein TSTA_003700 [Talaromyces stipitatus ATCC 10500]EED12313.1 conserved hypothetical protein [Talaromyces stipitatus ATCC 10500]
MDESSVFARQANSCIGPYQFYQCSKGPFVGCCSINPCDDGICPAENRPGGDSTQTTQPTTMTTMSITSTTAGDDHTASVTSMQQVTSTLVTSAGYSVVTETVGAPTRTVDNIATASSTAVDPTATSSSHKTATIGGAVGGIVGVIIVLLCVYIWYRRRKTAASLESQEKNGRQRGQTDSDYTMSSSWTGPFGSYNDKEATPFRHVDRTRSSIVSELDSSPVSPLTRSPRNMTSSETIFELDSGANNDKHSTIVSTPSTPNFPSISSRYTGSDGWQPNSHLQPWNGTVSEQDIISHVSSTSTGGVRIASAGHSSTKSDTYLGWHQ